MKTRLSRLGHQVVFSVVLAGLLVSLVVAGLASMLMLAFDRAGRTLNQERNVRG
jgi:hypothetical protein